MTFDRASSPKNTDDDTVSTVKFEKTEEEDNSERAVSETHPYRSDTDKEYGRTGEKNGNVFYMEAYRRKMTSADSVSLTTEANPEPISAHFEIQQDDVEGPSKDFIRIMRTSLVEPILKFLRDVQHHACTPNAALYINKILYNIRELEDKSPDDPFLEVLSGLYMALAYENQWANYTADQFESIGDVLRRLVSRPFPKDTDIEKAIIAMENIGFDTTPIPVSIEEDDM